MRTTTITAALLLSAASTALAAPKIPLHRGGGLKCDTTSDIKAIDKSVDKIASMLGISVSGIAGSGTGTGHLPRMTEHALEAREAKKHKQKPPGGNSKTPDAPAPPSSAAAPPPSSAAAPPSSAAPPPSSAAPPPSSAAAPPSSHAAAPSSHADAPSSARSMPTETDKEGPTETDSGSIPEPTESGGGSKCNVVDQAKLASAKAKLKLIEAKVKTMPQATGSHKWQKPKKPALLF